MTSDADLTNEIPEGKLIGFTDGKLRANNEIVVVNDFPRRGAEPYLRRGWTMEAITGRPAAEV